MQSNTDSNVRTAAYCVDSGKTLLDESCRMREKMDTTRDICDMVNRERVCCTNPTVSYTPRVATRLDRKIGHAMTTRLRILVMLKKRRRRMAWIPVIRVHPTALRHDGKSLDESLNSTSVALPRAIPCACQWIRVDTFASTPRRSRRACLRRAAIRPQNRAANTLKRTASWLAPPRVRERDCSKNDAVVAAVAAVDCPIHSYC